MPTPSPRAAADAGGPTPDRYAALGGPESQGGGPALGAGEARAPEAFTRERRLLDAAQRGDRATIERALELGVPIETKDDLGRTALLLATSDAGDLELVRFLAAKGARVDEPDSQGRAAISFAAAAGRLDLVAYLAESGAVADRPDWQKRTPLFHAALSDRVQVVAFLLQRGADPNAADRFGDTPLIVACAKGNAATAALLVQRGADASIRDQEGRSARERAAPGTVICERLPPS